MRLSQDGTHLVTASSDKTAKIVDVQDLQVLKMYPFDRPANAADISPIADHVSTGCYSQVWGLGLYQDRRTGSCRAVSSTMPGLQK